MADTIRTISYRHKNSPLVWGGEVKAGVPNTPIWDSDTDLTTPSDPRDSSNGTGRKHPVLSRLLGRLKGNIMGLYATAVILPFVLYGATCFKDTYEGLCHQQRFINIHPAFSRQVIRRDETPWFYKEMTTKKKDPDGSIRYGKNVLSVNEREGKAKVAIVYDPEREVKRAPFLPRGRNSGIEDCLTCGEPAQVEIRCLDSTTQMEVFLNKRKVVNYQRGLSRRSFEQRFGISQNKFYADPYSPTWDLTLETPQGRKDAIDLLQESIDEKGNNPHYIGAPIIGIRISTQLDPQVLSSEQDYPYSFNFHLDTSKFAPGLYQVEAKCRDKNGKEEILTRYVRLVLPSERDREDYKQMTSCLKGATRGTIKRISPFRPIKDYFLSSNSP